MSDELSAYAAIDPDVPLLIADFVGPTAPRGEFRTATRQVSPALPTFEVAVRSTGARAIPLIKTDRNPYEAFIFVGRASTCDVIFRDASVSKSHAIFEREPGAWTLRDNRSHNGTFLDDRRLIPGERARIASGAALRFGAYAVYFTMPPDLRRMLETMGAPE